MKVLRSYKMGPGSGARAARPFREGDPTSRGFISPPRPAASSLKAGAARPRRRIRAQAAGLAQVYASPPASPLASLALSARALAAGVGYGAELSPSPVILSAAEMVRRA